MMKYYNYFLLMMIAAVGGCASSQGITILALGMSREAALDVLSQLEAEDFSNQMSAISQDPQDQTELKEWMWSLDNFNITLETKYTDDHLSLLNIWDWQGRQLTSYHHTMEYDEISKVVFNKNGNRFHTVHIKTHNKE